MHTFFCTNPETCPGIPQIETFTDNPFKPLDDACIYANESIWALLGIKFGFRVFESEPPKKNIPNFPDHRGDASSHIGPDIKKEYTKGWLRMLSWSYWTSPMFVKNESNYDNEGNWQEKHRIIKDFSKPDDKPVNSFASYRRITYMTIRSAVAYMIPFCFFALVDISDAFRTMAIHPSQSTFLVYNWFGRLFQDMRVPWGLRPSSEFFCRLSALVRLIILAQGFIAILVYCDDFFMIGNTKDEAESIFQALKVLLIDLGFTWKPHKCISPRQHMKWLGFFFKSNIDGNGKMGIFMDPEKLKKLRNMLASVVKTKNVTTKTLQKIAGLSIHLAQTVYGARLYTRNIIRMIHTLPSRTLLSSKQLASFMHDARFWISEVQKHDGSSIIIEKPAISNTYIATDAAVAEGKVIGIGYFIDGDYLSLCHATAVGFLRLLHVAANTLQRKHKANFPFNKKNPNSHFIAYLELFAVWWLISSNPERFRNRYLPIRVDNTNTVSWLEKQSAPIPYLPIIRPLISLMREYNIRFYPIWTASKANELADLASRGEIVKLKSLLAEWRQAVDTSIYCPLPTYMKPGPLFLWRHGYYGRDVPDAWVMPLAELIDDDIIDMSL